jgi:DNA-binding NtrC family response regulator
MELSVPNGLDTYPAIREINPQAVAIMMTDYRQAIVGLVEEALRNHPYTCLHKPLDIEELLRLLEEIRERKRKAGSGGTGRILSATTGVTCGRPDNG